MHSSQLIRFFTLLASSSSFVSVTALPLNINLGAYSPALVVGDGEISFGGNQDVSNLMNALEGAAVSSAANNAAPPAAAPATPAPAPAREAAQPATPEVPPPDQQQAAQIASLQGMGKEIAPRVVAMAEKAGVQKRDLSGFDRALRYAADALRTSPGVSLGTGEEGTGIGIKQLPGGVAAAAPAQRPAGAKRDEMAILPKMKTVVTTMIVRGGPTPAGAQEKRSVSEPEAASVAKRTPGAIDGVNLNMAEGQVAELTFVETTAAGVDADDFDDDE